MNSKSLLIPIAAFAVAVTGVQAFDSNVLEEAGLTDTQIEAFETAKEMREGGDRDGARDVLLEAGIDENTMHSIRDVMHDKRDEMHQAMETALDNDDYAAFQSAVEGSPLADIITSQADFELFKEAHEHRQAADEIMQELGMPARGEGEGMGPGHHKGGFGVGFEPQSEN